jgi:hypothetical protein
MKIDLNLLTQQKETLQNMISMMSGNDDVVEDLTGLLHLVDAVQDEHEDRYPNGLTCYLETHHEIVSEITQLEGNGHSDRVTERREEQGQGGIYELAIELTDKFEKENKGVLWGEDKMFYDEIEIFLKNELYKGRDF